MIDSTSGVVFFLLLVPVAAGGVGRAALKLFLKVAKCLKDDVKKTL